MTVAQVIGFMLTTIGAICSFIGSAVLFYNQGKCNGLKIKSIDICPAIVLMIGGIFGEYIALDLFITQFCK